MSKKNKRVCATLKYIEHLLIFVSIITGCVSISAFVSLDGIPVGIGSFAVGIKICAMTAGIENYKSSSKKKRKNYDRIVLWTKTKLNTIEVLISRALID